jgi:hypothetical protein
MYEGQPDHHKGKLHREELLEAEIRKLRQALRNLATAVVECDKNVLSLGYAAIVMLDEV